MKYDIFISYRRKGGYETAKHLFSDCYDEGDLNVSAKYDPEDCFFLFKADASDSDGGYADSAKSTENSPECPRCC